MLIKTYLCKNGNKYFYYFTGKIKIIYPNGNVKWFTKNILKMKATKKYLNKNKEKN